MSAQVRLGTPESFAKFIAAERARWMDVTAAAGIKVD